MKTSNSHFLSYLFSKANALETVFFITSGAILNTLLVNLIKPVVTVVVVR